MDFTILYYLIPAFLAFLGVIQYDIGKHQYGKHLLWYTIYVYLVLLIGLRYEVGGDTLTYMGWFPNAHSLENWALFDISNVFEPGFTIIVACVKSLGGDFYHFQVVHSIILNSCIFYFISKNTQKWFSAILIAFLTYYIYFSTEILREAIAVFVFILNFKSFTEHNWIRYYAGVIICILFHFSASFLLVLPLLSRIKFDFKYIWIVIAFVIVCLFLRPITEIIGNIAPIIGAKAQNYERYGNVGCLWEGLRLIQFTVIPLLTLVLCKKVFHYNPKFEIAYLISSILGIGILFVPIIFQRFTNYFYPLIALSYADVITSQIVSYNINKRFTSLILIGVLFLGYGSYYVHLDFYQMWLPYSSILNPKSYSIRYQFYGGGSG